MIAFGQRIQEFVAMTFGGPVMPKPSADQMPSQFMLWIDSVGGFWVARGNELVIGQPGDQKQVDLPILADISARHARIRRDGEWYLLDAWRDVRVAGKKVEQTHCLTDQSSIELGESVKLNFRRPHALSSTARLDFVSRHRTLPTSDGILLLAETLVLGPKATSHVICRDWTKEIVLFRRENRLYCHVSGSFEIDGKTSRGQAELRLGSRIRGDGFSFSLAPIERA